MCCIKLLRGLLNIGCEPIMSGIKKIYLTYADSVFPVVDLSANTVTKFYIYEGVEWYQYDFAKNSANLTSTLNKDNGLITYTHQLSFNINGLSNGKNVEMMELAKHRLVGVAIDNAGKSWFLGFDGALINTSDSWGTGSAPGDRMGYSLSFEAQSKYLPFQFVGDIQTDTETTTEPVVSKSFSIIPNPAYIIGNSTSVMVTLKYQGRQGDSITAYTSDDIQVGDIVFTGDTASVRIYLPYNTTEDTLTYTVSFAGNGVQETLTIVQSPANEPTPEPGPPTPPTPPTPGDYLNVSPTSVSVTSSGGTQTITISTNKNWKIE